jgi:hypothetical protein
MVAADDILHRCGPGDHAQRNQLGHMWQQAAILTGFALLLVTVSVKRFSKTME